jgi:hypothetical protein
MIVQMFRRSWLVPASCSLMLVFQTSAAEAPAPSAMQHFALLQRALTQYEDLARQPGLTELPPLPGRAVRTGESYEGVGALRSLLITLGDLHTSTTFAFDGNATATLDAPLVAALKRFQERHGLDQDGVLGPATWRALTTPMSARVRQIEQTLARWRSLPPNPYRRTIFINIPRFRLYAMNAMDDREAALLQMDVVVGRAVEKLHTPAAWTWRRLRATWLHSWYGPSPCRLEHGCHRSGEKQVGKYRQNLALQLHSEDSWRSLVVSCRSWIDNLPRKRPASPQRCGCRNPDGRDNPPRAATGHWGSCMP